MSLHSHRTGWVYTTALSWGSLAQRFSFVLFLFFSLGILFLGHTQPRVVEKLRTRVVDAIAPALDVMSRPLVMIDEMSLRVQSYRSLLAENEKLKAENARLSQWQNVALSLENQNKELRGLLNYKSEPSLAYVSARVIAETGGAFSRTLVVTAGRVDGVREGMAAMTGDGLVGRIVEVGDWTSRILMITDINSRVPVSLVNTGDHAILAGNNENLPSLMYLPQDADVKEGDRVMTSGHGGVFPPDLPVGVVSKSQRDEFYVAPMANLGHVNHVRLVDFNLRAGSVNPMVEKIQSSEKSD